MSVTFTSGGGFPVLMQQVMLTVLFRLLVVSSSLSIVPLSILSLVGAPDNVLQIHTAGYSIIILK